METRTRKKMKEQNVKTDHDYHAKKSVDSVDPEKSESIFGRIFFISSLWILLTATVIGIHIWNASHKANIIDDVLHTIGLHQRKYAVIIDAGSTGSRVLVPSFYKNQYTGQYVLNNELFIQVKPGLSSYVDDPKKGAESIKRLIEQAAEFIPSQFHNSTIIAVRATAGLRLLSESVAENILTEVKDVVNSSPFWSDDDDCVAIMDGKDEGLFSWFTVNFLMDRLGQSLDKSVVTLDLGGGSIQIFFVPTDVDEIKAKTPQNLYEVKIMGKHAKTYSSSYLGLGLMSARISVFAGEGGPDANRINSSCVHPSIKDKKWTYAGRDYYISGYSGVMEIDTQECMRKVRKVVQSGNIDQPKQIRYREIVAFSYFYDRAFDSGMIVKGSDQNSTVTLGDFEKARVKQCKSPNANQPLLCLDLSFITSLLHEGFGFDSDSKIKLVDRIDDHEISWALGAAYHILENGI